MFNVELSLRFKASINDLQSPLLLFWTFVEYHYSWLTFLAAPGIDPTTATHTYFSRFPIQFTHERYHCAIVASLMENSKHDACC